MRWIWTRLDLSWVGYPWQWTTRVLTECTHCTVMVLWRREKDFSALAPMFFGFLLASLVPNQCQVRNWYWIHMRMCFLFRKSKTTADFCGYCDDNMKTLQKYDSRHATMLCVFVHSSLGHCSTVYASFAPDFFLAGYQVLQMQQDARRWLQRGEGYSCTF